MKNNEVGLFGLIWWWLKRIAVLSVETLRKWLNLLDWKIIVILSFVTWGLGMVTPSAEFRFVVLAGLLGTYILYVVYKILIEKKKDSERWMKIILLGGMVMRMLFVLMSGYRAFNYHDAGGFAGPNAPHTSAGHYGYMEYIMKHWSMPPQDPTKYWSFYNPPLYYIVSAIVLTVTSWFTQAPLMYESIQIVPMLFASLTVWNIYKMLGELNIRKKPMTLIMAIVALNPFFLLAGTMVTPDAMFIFFAVMVLRYLMQWLRVPSTKNTVKIAVMLGLGALTKLSIVMLIPAIIFAFLYKKRARQLLIGILVCLPMLLFNPLRMMVQFHLPPTWTQKTGFVADAELSSLQHLAVPAMDEFSYGLTSAEKTKNGSPGGNIWMMTIRQAMFDELKDKDVEDHGFEIICLLGFYAAVLMVIMANVGLIRSFTTWKKPAKVRMISFGTIGTLTTAYVTALICFLSYNMDEPFFCTTSYRYIGYTMVIPLLCSGVFLTRRPNSKFTKLFYVVGAIFVIMMILIDVGLLFKWMMGAGWEKPNWIFYN